MMAWGKMKYELEERSAQFGEKVIDLVRSLKSDVVNVVLIRQIVRSATSIGANYMEANNSVSRKDFKNKIGICKKEASETKHWLRMLIRSNNYKERERTDLWREADELTKIFSKIFMSSR